MKEELKEVVMDAVAKSAMAEVGEAMKSRTTADKTRPAASICSTHKGWEG